MRASIGKKQYKGKSALKGGGDPSLSWKGGRKFEFNVKKLGKKGAGKYEKNPEIAVKGGGGEKKI